MSSSRTRTAISDASSSGSAAPMPRSADRFSSASSRRRFPPAPIASPTVSMTPELAALAFALASYRFERYRKPKADGPRLVVPEGVDAAALSRVARCRLPGRAT